MVEGAKEGKMLKGAKEGGEMFKGAKEGGKMFRGVKGGEMLEGAMTSFEDILRCSSCYTRNLN